MIRKRAELDLDNPPGQVVNPIPRELTIGGIVDRIMKDEPKKLTFDEWYAQNRIDFGGATVPQLRFLWVSAQENK